MTESCLKDPLVTGKRGKISHCGIDQPSCTIMSDRNLASGDHIHSDAALEGHAKTMKAESFAVLKPSIIFTSDSGLKEEELHSEIDIVCTKSRQYFSTPVQSNRRQWASTLTDLQENHLGYKSFFRLECDEIIDQLQSKAAQGWSASKRKLEELDISTIEAEPLPLLCCTPKSVLDETTCSAKRRRLDYEGDGGNVSREPCLTKHNSPGFRTSQVQGLEKVHGLKLCSNGDIDSIQEKSSIHCTSESHSKGSMFLKTGGTAYPLSNLPANGKKSVPGELKSGTCSPLLRYRISNQMSFQHHESPTSALEFRSFFAAECEKICNQLKRRDAEGLFGNVFSIEAEPPPVLSATGNSTIILELGSTCKENSIGISQLDLEKMNINFSVTERTVLLQKASDTVPSDSNAAVTDTAQDSVKIYEAASLANITHDINKSADGAMQEIKILHSLFPIADVTQDISMMPDKVTEANATQDIIKMHGNVPPADTPQANVRMCEGVALPCIMQDKVPVANNTQDITMCGDISIVNGTHVLVAVDDWSAMNAIQKNLTCSKMPLNEVPTRTRNSDVSEANNTHNIGALCNKAPAVEAKKNVTRMYSKNSADATQEVMSMFNEVCVADGTRGIMTTEKLSDVTVDIGTMASTGIDPEDNDTNIVHASSLIPAKKDMVMDAPLQNVTFIKTDENLVNYQNIVSVNSEITPHSAVNKTFTHCKVIAPNVTYDMISVNPEIVINSVQDLTQLISYKNAPNIPPDTSIIDEKPKINSTQILMPLCNNVTADDSHQDSDDLTKVIATNCTMLDYLSKNARNQAEKQSGHLWPITALAHSSPRRGSMCDGKDATYNLDLTDIAHESVLFKRPIPFITSTPLPSLSNQVFVKKSCGLPVKSKPSMFSDQKDDINKVILAQRAAMPQVSVTGQSLGGEPKARGGTSQGVQYPNFSISATPKLMKSRMPQPAPYSTLAQCDLKAQPMTKAVLLKKDPVALGRTSMKPPLAPTSLPRKNLQPCKSGASSSILSQQTPVNCKDFVKKRIDVSMFPASSLRRPPFGLSTPGCQIYSGKFQSISVPQSAARVCKSSSVHQSSVPAGFDPSGNVLQEHTFIRPANPIASHISSNMKLRASGLPVRKPQEAFSRPSTK